MVLIAPLVSDLVKSVWSAPSISIGVLDLALFFKQYLVKKEEQTSYSKRYSVHFGQVSTV